ncbi:MAG: PTS sugar transporter subunit IIA [Candidatus Bathyarchaeia archaeon]
MDVEIIFAENLKCGDSIEVLQKLSEILVRKGYADPELPGAIIKREKEFPTGLELKCNVNVAIPHADARYVHKPAVLVAKLANPVKFQHMVDGREIDVDIVLLLALNDPHKQIQTLQKLASALENEEIVLRLKSVENSEMLAGILEEILKR